MAAVDALCALVWQASQEIVWVEDLTARTRETHDELERIAARDDDRQCSPITTFAEFAEPLSELRQIGRTMIGRSLPGSGWT